MESYLCSVCLYLKIQIHMQGRLETAQEMYLSSSSWKTLVSIMLQEEMLLFCLWMLK